MKKIACYCRVSTSEQTVDNQKIRLIEYAEQQGVTYDMFEETESTRINKQHRTQAHPHQRRKAEEKECQNGRRQTLKAE